VSRAFNQEEDIMRKRTGAVAAAVGLVGIAAVGVGVLPSTAQVPPPPIASEFLTPRSVFPDDVDLKMKIKDDGRERVVVNAKDPSRTVVVRFTVQPGAQFPWHTHAGPVVVNMVQGELTYVEAEDCARHTYSSGEAFVDPGHGHVHSAFNPTGGETIFIATFYESPATGPLVIPADPADCPLT
jgi:quercetin dioxygenase-like cupin family protein